MRVCPYVWLCVRVSACILTRARESVHVSVCMAVCACVLVCMYTCVHQCLCVYVYACGCAYPCVLGAVGWAGRCEMEEMGMALCL